MDGGIGLPMIHDRSSPAAFDLSEAGPAFPDAEDDLGGLEVGADDDGGAPADGFEDLGDLLDEEDPADEFEITAVEELPAAQTRPPVLPLVHSTHWRSFELDVYTLDRGAEHGFILSNIYVDGQLLLTRRVGYAEDANADHVLSLMQQHQDKLLADLQGGALDADLDALLHANVEWARPGNQPPPAPLPAPTPQPLPDPTYKILLPPEVPFGAEAAGAAAVRGLRAAGPKVITAVLERPEELLPLLYQQPNGSGVRVETSEHVELGNPVDVAIRFLGRPIRQFLVHGKVIAHRPPSRATPTGDLAVMVEENDRVALDRAVEFARGIHDPTTDRKTPRVPCSFSAVLELEGGRIQKAQVMNISEGGAMIGRTPPLLEGARVMLVSTLPSGEVLRVAAESRWFRTDGAPVMGVRFLHTDATRTLVAQLTGNLLDAQ